MIPNSRTAIFHKGNFSKQLGRQPIVPVGGLLGGGGSINLMLYTRGQQSDYDSWNMPGWSTKELMPYFRKLETYHGRGHKAIHGYSGPVHCTRGPFLATKSENDFIDACAQKGIPNRPDMQDFETANGTERWLRTVSTEGKRQDAAHTYIHPLLADGKHPNLHVLCQRKVVRVLFDGDRASGVEFIPNPAYEPSESLTPAPRTPQAVRARKLVVVSSGALGTPPILERSGIGSKTVLQKAGIEVKVDLPGVGHDYQDHHLAWYTYRTSLAPNETLDALVSGRYPVEKARSKKDPILGWNGCDVSAKVRPTDAEVARLSSKFQRLWKHDWSESPERPIVIYTCHSAFLGDPATIEPGQYVSVATYTTYPYSRGHVHVTGPQWENDLDFDAGFFSGENGDFDIEQHVWAYKKQREIMRRSKMYRGELEVGHPAFNENSAAKTTNLLGHLKSISESGKVEDLVYTSEDDAAIEKHLRDTIATTWHSLGTCKMAPRESLGVVDGNLNVYGVRGLKLADLSIVPQNVAANTNNTALMIGEKCAGLILKDLKLEDGVIPSQLPN